MHITSVPFYSLYAYICSSVSRLMIQGSKAELGILKSLLSADFGCSTFIDSFSFYSFTRDLPSIVLRLASKLCGS